MWIINKPDFSKTIDDIKKFTELEIISQNDERILESLVNDYNNQNGSITDKQCEKVNTNTSESILKNYEKLEKGEKLYFIRESLMKDVYKCPYCSINEVSTLDHYMSKSTYKALSLCRLNLVPMCWCCNRTKGHLSYEYFIHPYYFHIKPGTIFLLADVQVHSNELVAIFTFDKDLLNDQSLYDLLSNHWSKLHMDERLNKSVIDFIHSNFLNMSDDLNTYKTYIQKLLTYKENEIGKNDWRTAILRDIFKKLEGINSICFYNALRNSKNNYRNNII